MTADRETTVLFAHVAGAIRDCIDVIRGITEESGGRVVKTIGDRLMATFPSPDGATQAAARMQTAVSALPLIDDAKLSLRIGFHAGPILERDGDIFGDTVNIAARLAAQAINGQALTSADTATKLTAAWRNATRHLYDITLKGKADEIALCEVLWSESPDVTLIPADQAQRSSVGVRLRLRKGTLEVVHRDRLQSISIGRDPESVIAVADTGASRQHCVIERRQNHFVVRDHSSNGTFISVDGDKREILLRREEFVLRGHGWLAFGHPKSEATEVVEYFCEEDS